MFKLAAEKKKKDYKQTSACSFFVYWWGCVQKTKYTQAF